MQHRYRREDMCRDFNRPFRYRVTRQSRLIFTSQVIVPPQDLVASAWDFNLKTWVHLSLVGVNARLEEPERFVGPDGEIRIQVRTKNSGWTEIQSSYITMTVKP